MLIRILFVFIFLYPFIISSLARPFITIDALSADNENIQGKISQVIQDKKGFIWFSSFNGLHKYDGYKISKFKSDPQRNSFLIANRISLIAANSNDDIWCLSAGRLYMFKESEEIFVDVQTMFEEHFGYNIEILNMYPLSSGYTWMVSTDGECFRINDNSPFEKCYRSEQKQNKCSDVVNITLDSSGNEWIITKKGIFRNDKLISKTRFFYLYESADKLWISSFSGLTYIYNNADNSFVSYKMPSRLKRIYHQEYHNDSILVTASDCGIFVTNTLSGKSDWISDKEFHSVYRTSDGDFIATDPNKNMYFISGLTGTCSAVSLPSDITFNDFRIYFKEDSQGLIWLVFHDNTNILYYDRASGAFEKPGNLPAKPYKVTGHLEDAQGNIWFRRDRAIEKVSFINPPFNFFFNNEQEIRSFFVDHLGRKWIGYRTPELAIYSHDNKYIGHLNNQGRIVNTPVQFSCVPYSIMQDSKGCIWIGTKNNGLYLLKPFGSNLEFSVSHFMNKADDKYSLSKNSVYSILEDSNNNIWIATNGGGLNLWDKGSFINVNNDLFQSAARVPKYVRYISEIKKGVIMIGAKEGLFTFDSFFNSPEEIKLYCSSRDSKDNSLSDTDIMFFQKSRADESIYVATNSGGINKILSDNLLSNNLLFQAVTKSDGLASDVAFSFVEDQKGILWILSENAISHYNPQNGVIENFDASYFSKGIVFSEAIPVYHNNRVYFSSNKGLCEFSPSEVVKGCYTAPLEFTNLHVQNNPSFFRINKDGILNLDSDERNINLTFAALDFRGISKIKYAYFLENVDKNWNVTSDNSVTYLNIPKGKHVLRLKSTNAEGIWCDNERRLTINVHPAFFESNTGYVVISFIVITIFAFIILLYQRFYVLNQKLSFEKQMTDVKLRFFTDISHELRTPLTLIDGPVTLVLEDKTLSPQSRRYIETVKNNTTRMLTLVNQILDFRKIQNRKMELLIVQIDPHEMIQRIADNFYDLAKSHNISLSVINEVGEDEVISVDLDKFEKIFFNILSNAFKYTPDNKDIEIRISKNNDNIDISIKDSGIGIAQDLIPGLFTRFETIMKNNLFKPSSGIGLSLVKQYSDMHHAEISVDSTPGIGTCFTISFRLGYNHFSNDDNVEFLASDISSDNIVRPTIEQLIDKTNCDKPSVLIVEDNSELRDFIKSVLLDEYNVIEACNGDEGLTLAKKHWPDMIVSDIMMPVMDGLQMLSRIKQDKDIYTIPVILLTAKSTVNDQIEGTKTGADDYIVKPFSPNYMKTKIASLINQRTALKQALLDSLSDKKTIAPIGISIEPELPVITSADEAFINRVKAFVEGNIDNAELSMSDFADAMNMGRTTFTNKFKGILGVTPVEFVHDMRMKRAKQLIESKNFTISEIAFKSGFSDPKYFSACFKRYYGETPSNFRRQ